MIAVENYESEVAERCSCLYRCIVEASSAVVARESRAVDDLVFTVGASEARLTVALVSAKAAVTTHSSVETWAVCCAVVQVYAACAQYP